MQHPPKAVTGIVTSGPIDYWPVHSLIRDLYNTCQLPLSHNGNTNLIEFQRIIMKNQDMKDEKGYKPNSYLVYIQDMLYMKVGLGAPWSVHRVHDYSFVIFLFVKDLPDFSYLVAFLLFL